MCVCVVTSFTDVLVTHLTTLSSSPILAVRRLSSQAVTKLIPQCNVSSFVNDIVSSLPLSNVSLVRYNWLHGRLLQLHSLLKHLLTTTVDRYVMSLLAMIAEFLLVLDIFSKSVNFLGDTTESDFAYWYQFLACDSI